MKQHVPFELSPADRQRIEAHHAKQKPVLFEDNLPWDDPDFTRRFTRLTDVRHRYWGSPDADVDRVFSILGRKRKPAVVDLCCGAGRHAIALTLRGATVTGIDISPYAIRRARGKAAADGVKPGFIIADVADPPPLEPADAVLLICEQVTNFAPKVLPAVLRTWMKRVRPGGALVIETPTELAPAGEELYYFAEPLFFDGPCWIRYTQAPDPVERTLLETFTCLEKPNGQVRSFFNSRKYYTAGELAGAANAASVQVIDVPARAPRPDLQWVVLR